MNYQEIINKSVLDLPKSGIRKFFDIASTMEDCISLGVGEPDFVTPWEIRDSAIKSIQSGRTQYTSNAGLISFRKEIAYYVSSRYGVKYDPENEIIVTIGASEAIDLALRTIAGEGDEVLVPSPSYVSYLPSVALTGAKAVPVEPSVDDEFKLTPEVLKKAITNKTKAIIFPYPNNPTGAIMTKEEMEKITPIIKEHNLIVISDEIYSELTYGDERHVSIASLDGMWERTILINGFSKAFAMTGWRLGYLCAPKPLAEQMYKIHQYVIMCAPTASQIAGETALKIGRNDGYRMVEEMRQEYDKRRRYLIAEFNKMGLDCFEPKGAFYVFPSLKRTGMTGEEFAEKLLFAKAVAVVPGSAFGESGKNFIRCSYATSMKDLKEAIRRIREFLVEIGVIKD